jgi:hypothetical protein
MDFFDIFFDFITREQLLYIVHQLNLIVVQMRILKSQKLAWL